MPLARSRQLRCFPFFFNATATTEIYTLSLHDALPIALVYALGVLCTAAHLGLALFGWAAPQRADDPDRKSTRLNSSHLGISYAVFCLKKNKISTARSCRSTYDSAREPRRTTS